MAIKQQLLFFLLLSFPSCMINQYKLFPQRTLRILAEIQKEKEKKRHACLGWFRLIPFELIGSCMGNLDYKVNMRLIMTCKGLYDQYAGRNEILFTEHYLNQSDYTDAMIHFARKEDKAKFELFIKHEGPLNKKNREDILWHFNEGNRTNMLWYVDKENREEDILRYFYSSFGIDIYKKQYNSDDNTSFSCAEIKRLCTDHNAVLTLILKQGYKYDFNNGKDDGELQNAVLEEDINYIKGLLLLDNSLVNRNIQDKYNWAALHSAVIHEKIEALKLLLADPYVDPNIQDKDGYTALHFASMGKKKVELLKLLVADPRVNCNITTNYGSTAYSSAKNPEIKALLAQRTSF